MQHDYQYVPRKEWLPVRRELEELINDVQNEVREEFTFSFTYVGSCSRNMVTRDRKSNVGYDFDVNLHINDDDEIYSPDELRHILKNAFDKHIRRYNYDTCEDSTRVLTIKKRYYSNIIHSCDICIVYDCDDGRQQYIHFDKNQNSYAWKYLPVSNKTLAERAKWITHNGHLDELKKLYLTKKNENDNPDRKSRSMYAESVNEVYMKYHKGEGKKNKG